jgi:hypothetical protein
MPMEMKMRMMKMTRMRKVMEKRMGTMRKRKVKDERKGHLVAWCWWAPQSPLAD